MLKISFLGAGSFGTALGVVLANKGYDVTMWARNSEVVNGINSERRNIRYLKSIDLPENITAYTSIEEAIDGAKYIVLSVASHAVRSVCKELKKYIKEDQVIVNLAKGIEEHSYLRLSEVIEEEIRDNKIGVLSGPSHAEEIAIGVPTTLVATSKCMDTTCEIQDLFTTPYLRIYSNEDIVGVEIGGAVKNIIALAAGVSDGIGYGDNTKAAIMTRSISEIKRIALKLGAKEKTISGLTGIGDLIVTCTSMHSRNRRAGILIGKGYKAEDALREVGAVVEGYTACKAFYELKERENVYMPITDILYNILFRGLDSKLAVTELMNKDKKHEME